ncbi:MAG TPA: DUF2057 family protein [Dongiaceae bacterium]|nr:DUF2057 family protein [Dongiaceae bacterium]
MKYVVLLLSVLTLAACASGRHHELYEGDPAQASRIESFDTVLIKYIDDTDVGIGFIGQKHVYDIKAGQHTLLVEYSDIFDVDADNHEKIVSRPAKITFVAEAGKRYQVQHEPQKRLNHAKSFAEKPDFWVVELSSDTRVPSTVELSRPREFFEGLKFENTPTYEFASDKVAASAPATGAVVAGGAAAGAVVAGSSATPTPAAAGSGAATGTESAHLKMLQYSWQNASAAEREAFLRWIGKP